VILNSNYYNILVSITNYHSITYLEENLITEFSKKGFDLFYLCDLEAI